MEKTLFFFRRNPQRDPQDFEQHYINNHAKLGKRLTRCLLGYTVNIVKSANGPDAITEHWVPRAMDILTPDIAYASVDDFNEVLVDDRTMFSGFELYVVVDQIETVPGPQPDTPLETATPGVKLIWTYADAASAPPPPASACRVLDNIVGYRLVHDGQGWQRLAPDFRLVRMAWVDDVTQAGPAANTAIVTTEYRFIPAPQWESEAA